LGEAGSRALASDAGSSSVALPSEAVAASAEDRDRSFEAGDVGRCHSRKERGDTPECLGYGGKKGSLRASADSEYPR